MKYSIKKPFLLFAFILVCGMVSAQDGDKILGTYRVISDATKEAANVKISKDGNNYRAQIIWLEKPLDERGEPRRDKLNPDPALRSVPGDKIILMWDVRYDSGKQEWSGGRIYDPDTGKIYKVVLKFENPSELKVRGYIGMPALGRTMIWKRTDQAGR